MFRKKAGIKIAAALCVALALVTVTAYAMFSDDDFGLAKGQVGSVKLDDINFQIKDVPVEASGSGEFGKKISNWNPGDANTIKWDVINKGNKSIDTRNTLIIYWDEEPDLKENGIIYLYPTSMSDKEILEDLRSDKPSKFIQIDYDDTKTIETANGTRKGIVHTFEGDILDGQGLGAETGDHERNGHIGSVDEHSTTKDHIEMKLVLSPNAPAIYMGKKVVVNVITEAKQYRNSTPIWTEVANEKIGIGGLSIVPSAQ